MKRNEQSELRSVRGVELYLDDYYELVAILATEGFKVSIAADEYTLENAEEINQLKRLFVHQLKLVSRQYNGPDIPFSYLSVDIEGARAKVHFGSTPDVQYGRALHLLDFLGRRRSALRRTSDFIFGQELLMVGAFTIGFLLLGIFEGKIKPLPTSQKIALVAAAFLPAVIIFAVGLRRHSDAWRKKQAAVYLSERSQRTGFVARHKDALEKLFIGVIVGVIVTLVGIWAKSWFGE